MNDPARDDGLDCDLVELREDLVAQAVDLLGLPATLAARTVDLVLHAVQDQVLTPDACEMRQGEPYDFAWCQTHDTTFPLGGTCRYDGRDPLQVVEQEAMEQRGLKVAAEMRAERAEGRVAALEDRVRLLTARLAYLARALERLANDLAATDPAPEAGT